MALGDGKPTVSIVVPVYNGEEFIGDSLRSIRAQKFSDYELIVVNDGSTDETVRVVKEVFPEARIIHQANCGLAATRNHGVAQARGKWVTFLDADDLWHASRLQTLMSFLAAHPDCQAVATTAKKFCVEGELKKIRQIGDWVDFTVHAGRLQEELVHQEMAETGEPAIIEQICNGDLIKGNRILSTSILLDRMILMRAGIFPMHMGVSEDYFCWINVAQLTPIWMIDSPTFYYQVHARSMSRTSEMMIPQLGQLLSHWYCGRRKPLANAIDAKLLKEAASGYKRWQFTELITKSIRAGNHRQVQAGLHLAYFLLPNPSLRMSLRMMVIKEYLKKYLFPGWYAKAGRRR